jgi:hypothetical protein
MQWATMRSPFWNAVTEDPTSTTTPDVSQPRIVGKEGDEGAAGLLLPVDGVDGYGFVLD